MKPNRPLALLALAIAAAPGAPSTAMATPAMTGDAMLGHAERCYQQTELATGAATQDGLTVGWCNRALRYPSLGREARSVILHNRGVIELALGQVEQARESFEQSVALSQRVDQRNLALAQVAHRQGDYRLAIEQYDLLLEANPADESWSADLPAIDRARTVAIDALREPHSGRTVSSSSH